jgi:signal transduction protein with GAF and PtsI domain
MFKLIRIVGAVTAEAVNRIQQDIQDAFADLNTVILRGDITVRDVTATPTFNTAAVEPEDRYIIVNSRGGPMKLALPNPSINTVVTIKNSTSGNKVTVAQANGKPTGDGLFTIDVPATKAITLVCDSTAWWLV